MRSKRGRRSRKCAGERKTHNRVACIDLCQHRARAFSILAHLGGERIRRGEGCIGTQEIDELDIDVLAVEVAGKVEQIGFENGLARTEGWTDADIARGVMAPRSVI